MAAMTEYEVDLLRLVLRKIACEIAVGNTALAAIELDIALRIVGETEAT